MSKLQNLTHNSVQKKTHWPWPGGRNSLHVSGWWTAVRPERFLWRGQRCQSNGRPHPELLPQANGPETTVSFLTDLLSPRFGLLEETNNDSSASAHPNDPHQRIRNVPSRVKLIRTNGSWLIHELQTVAFRAPEGMMCMNKWWKSSTLKMIHGLFTFMGSYTASSLMRNWCEV